MTLPIFAFNVDANNTARTTTHKTKQVQYGDGYKQLAPAGINNKIDTWDLTLPLINEASLSILEAFFDLVGQHKLFTWTPPRGIAGIYRVSSPVKYQSNGLDYGRKTRTTVTFSIELISAGSTYYYSATTFSNVIDLPYVDPYFANVVFQAIFEGANNSTIFTDAKGNLISTRSGTPRISNLQSLFNNGSLYFDGSSSLTVPASPTFESTNKDFRWDIALYPTLFLTGISQGILDHRSAAVAQTEFLNIRNQDGLGTVEHFNGATPTVIPKLKLNQWQVLSIERYQGIKTIYLDEIPIYSDVDTANYVYTGNLIIGDIVDVGGAFNGSFTGYMQYIRKTIGTGRKHGYQSGAQTFSRFDDSDPLEVFKVLDINCDSGRIVDTKLHVLSTTNATIDNTKKRAGSSSIAFSNGAIDIAGGTDFNFGSLPYSIELAVNMTAVGLSGGLNTPNSQYFCDFDGGTTSSIIFTSNGGLAQWQLVNANAIATVFNQTPVVNTWYDLGLSKVDTKYLLIRNGQIVAASNNAPTTVNLSTMRLGNYRSSFGAGVAGNLDSIKVYKGIANGSNLTHNYPLRFLVRFDGSANDELGAIATVVGTPPTYDTANKRSLGASGLFNGTGYYTYPAIAAYNLGAGGFELAGWFRASTVQNTNAAIAAGGTSAGTFDTQSWILYNNVSGLSSVSGRSTTGKLSLFVAAVSTTNAILVSTTSINDNLAHYWRIVKYIIGSSAVTVLIVDGKIEDVYIGVYTIAATTRSLTIGTEVNAGGRIFTGNLDDIAIYRA